MTFKDYRMLRSTLELFSSEVGLSWAAANAALLRSAANDLWRAAFCQELASALRDPSTDWREALYNSDYEVLEFETQADARSFAVSLLWDPLNPGEAPPAVLPG